MRILKFSFFLGLLALSIIEVKASNHSHSWSSDYRYDQTHHWHVCLGEGECELEPPERSGYGAHEYVQIIDDKYKAEEASCSDGVRYYYACSVCGAKDFETYSVGEGTGEHNFSTDFAFNEKEHWNFCMGRYCDARKNVANHTLSAWSITKEATTTETGLLERSCSCGYSESQIIPKIEEKDDDDPINYDPDDDIDSIIDDDEKSTEAKKKVQKIELVSIIISSVLLLGMIGWLVFSIRH